VTIRVERELKLHLKFLKNPLLAAPTPRITTMHHPFFYLSVSILRALFEDKPHSFNDA
jgi:hypothetical protein